MSEQIFVATRKGLFTLERGSGTDGGPRWKIARAAFLGSPVGIVTPDGRDGTVYAALEHGHFGAKLHRSPDGGTSWEERAIPSYPAQPEGEVDLDPMGQQPIPWRLMRIWAIEPGGEDEPGVVWCGTIPGGLFQSADGGSSWNLVRSLWDHPKRKEWFGGGADYPGIHSICVDPRDSRHITLGVSCGGVWDTRDGGESWECRASGMWANYTPPEKRDDPNIQDPHRVVQCPAEPDWLWTQHHNGVFRSTDGAVSWTEISEAQPATFGFAVAVHPQDPRTAWFVPAASDECRIPVDGKVVVARTRDGGETFDVLDRGLPDEHSYDLTYRHALDVDDTGNRLVFGTTTGSLFVSEDQGDSWELISAHLPPVYCTRFVKA